ncbi:helix-turn-helix domain-containing protein [Clostridiales Family XIII bacterium ASD5510]|uniref:Helix-turn-helix domain-containing protein n=1 Tax=Hominibacterium faecale TaxID=2839743 RepID=A0A9J6QSA9_9FIRM|nr:DUF6017 domain-containing protein [Hominibacterium faecale]MCU7378893.1 helix-turn-helix domain-containing protein [Hominibacterium faecale]
MAVFRVNKTKNYTVMSNYHLQDKHLTLKAKGLLSLMLSLPDNWDYTLRGLATICCEGIDAIRTGVKELEKNGYIIRRQLRDAKGMMANIEYIIFEQPQLKANSNVRSGDSPNPGYPESENPVLENPITDKPISGKPKTVNPNSENATQLNTKKLNTKKTNTEITKNQSINLDANEKEVSLIKERIGYDLLIQDYDPNAILELIEIIAEIECQCKYNTQVRIGESHYPAAFVAKRFYALDYNHISYVMDCLKKSKNKITNIKSYLTMALFNSPATIQQFYDAEVRHDLK